MEVQLKPKKPPVPVLSQVEVRTSPESFGDRQFVLLIQLPPVVDRHGGCEAQLIGDLADLIAHYGAAHGATGSSLDVRIARLSPAVLRDAGFVEWFRSRVVPAAEFHESGAVPEGACH